MKLHIYTKMGIEKRGLIESPPERFRKLMCVRVQGGRKRETKTRSRIGEEDEITQR
jgi:hypothetical protein